MQKLQFQIEIQAEARKVYNTMLGLPDKSTYEFWTSVFNPTSTFEGNWEEGSKIYFVGQDENGKRGGMVSRVEANQVAKFVSILHYGFLDGETEVTSGELVEKWTGGHENYRFEERKGKTLVTVDLDVVEEYLDYFNEKYPAALLRLKEISER